MLVAVTGGMGFIGQEVICRLQDRGHRVILVDYWAEALRRYEAAKFPILESVYRTASSAELMLDPSEFISWLKGNCVDAVVHLGACVDTTDMASTEMIHDNVKFTQDLVRVINLRTSAELPGIVFASSAATYGTKGFPNNPYGLTKSIGERLITETRGDFVSLRFFNVFGRNEHHKGKMASVPFKLFQAYQDGAKFCLHSPDSARDFVPVTTVADQVVAYAELMKQFLVNRYMTAAGIRGTWDLGTGYATTFADLDNYIMQAVKQYTSCVRHVSIPQEMVGRYQTYTCAGQRAKNAGEATQTTREAIEEIYGR